MFNSLEYRKPWLARKTIQKLGLLNHRNVYWSWYEPRNFGDWIGPYLFQALTGKVPVFCDSSPNSPCTVYTSAGSIMRKINNNDTSIVWGSGIISLNDVFARPKRICAVRGPHTKQRCEQLGYNCPEIYGDPAILMPSVYSPPSEKKAYKLGIIPHFVDYDCATAAYRDMHDVLIVDVTKSVEDVINDINMCDATVSSSLHGLIISHAYGINSAWIKLSNLLEGDGIKFSDYYSAGGICNITPTTPKKNWKREDYFALAHDTPMPNNDILKKPLLASCPF